MHGNVKTLIVMRKVQVMLLKFARNVEITGIVTIRIVVGKVKANHQRPVQSAKNLGLHGNYSGFIQENGSARNVSIPPENILSNYTMNFLLMI